MAKFKCPCCGQMTLEDVNENSICPVCGWEDDWWDSNNPDSLPSCNYWTLNESRRLFNETGKTMVQLYNEKHKEQ